MRGEKGIWDFFSLFFFLVFAQFCCSNRTGSGASCRQRKAPLQRSEWVAVTSQCSLLLSLGVHQEPLNTAALSDVQPEVSLKLEKGCDTLLKLSHITHTKRRPKYWSSTLYRPRLNYLKSSPLLQEQQHKSGKRRIINRNTTDAVETNAVSTPANHMNRVGYGKGLIWYWC